MLSNFKLHNTRVGMTMEVSSSIPLIVLLAIF